MNTAILTNFAVCYNQHVIIIACTHQHLHCFKFSFKLLSINNFLANIHTLYVYNWCCTISQIKSGSLLWIRYVWLVKLEWSFLIFVRWRGSSSLYSNKWKWKKMFWCPNCCYTRKNLLRLDLIVVTF